MEGRLMRAEDLVAGGDAEGVGLERAVESWQIHGDLMSSLGSSASSNDDRNYANHVRYDGFYNSNSAHAQEPADTASSSWENKSMELSREGPELSRTAAYSGAVANGGGDFLFSMDSSGKAATAGMREEEDWESVLDELPIPGKPSSPTVHNELHSKENRAVKQRGRGSFTYGGMGLYSDNLGLNEDKNGPENSGSPSDHCRFPLTSHVLVLDCSSKITTKDVEEIVEPFSKEGDCAVRWVDNTRVLAVFSSPKMALEALVGINDGRFKVSMANETDVILGSQSSMSDMAKPLPRPAASAQVAQRMIASALSRQDISKQLLAKSQGSAPEIQKQERERKLRLQKRAQLRDEAWGSDDD